MQSIFTISEAIGVNRVFARRNRSRPIVLAFHGVTAEAPGHLCNYEGKHLHLPIFERLMEHVARNYTVVPLARVADWVEGHAALPERAVALTFDDGYRNVLTHAAPVLERLGLPATLFVVTDFVFHGRMLWPDRLMSALAVSTAAAITVPVNGSRLELPLGDDAQRRAADRRLTALCKTLPDAERLALLDRVIRELRVSEEEIIAAWGDHAPIQPDELKRLPDYGVEVGSHTCSHGIVTRFTPEAMTQELTLSKRLLEQATGRPCTEFSYPNGSPGDFSDASRERVIAAGYGCAVTTIKRRVERTDDRFAIPRCILTHNQITTAEFSAHVSGLAAFLRAVRARVTGAPPAPGAAISLLIASTLAVILAYGNVAWAQSTAGAFVLSDPISARVSAMGWTGTADNSDPANIWFNPANAIGRSPIYVEYGFWDLDPFSEFSDIDIELPLRRWAAGGSFPLSDRVNAGVSATFGELDYGKSISFSDQGIVIGTFESWERYVSVAFGVSRRVGNRVDVRLGVAGKRFWAEYAPPSFVQAPPASIEGDGIAFDAGTTVTVPVDLSGWTVTPALGFAYVNFGGEIDFEEVSDPFPARLHYGASIRVDGPDVALGAARVPLLSFVQNLDAVDRLHGDSYSWGMGAELAVMQILFLRAGSSDEQDEYDYDQSAWSIGIGAPVGPLRARFDYARVSRYDEPRYGFIASWEF